MPRARAYAAESSATAQREACEGVGELKVSLGQVLAERDEARAQLAAAEEEVADLKAAQDRIDSRQSARRPKRSLLPLSRR